MTAFELAKLHAEMQSADGELARAFLQARTALSEINQYNRMKNDLQTYLHDVAQWGMGDRAERPLPEMYGIYK